jgi:hypothetical protein
MLSPITPVLSDEIWSQLGYLAPLSELMPRWEDIAESTIPLGQQIQLKGPILPRLDSELAGASKKK